MNDPSATRAADTPPPACSVVELAKRIPFRMVMHMNCGNKHHLDYLNQALNLVCCITTPYRHGKPGKGVKEFALNERTAKPYKTLADLLKANPTIAKKAAEMYPPNTERLRSPASGDKQDALVGPSESQKEK